MQSSLRIIVTGLIAQHPLLPGMTWHYLQYVIGLRRLGHDVYYFEDSGEFPYTLDGGSSGTDWIARNCDPNVGTLAETMARYGCAERWAYHFPLKSQWYGLSDTQRQEVLRSADLLINVSGSLERPQDYRCVPHLLYVDTDPVITHIKMVSGVGEFGARASLHDSHFSFGESPTARVPVTGFCWLPTRQPIVLSEWHPDARRAESFTTVMNWTSYEPLRHEGQTYGQKDIEFEQFIDLPTLVSPARMEVALSRTQHLKWRSGARSRSRDDTSWEALCGPCPFLTEAGWHVVDSIERCGDLDSYRRYIESSKAEWSVAKNAYVVGQPGWFSERSACYLAAGRPVVVQDTGCADVLPVGEGLLTFRTLDEAVTAVRAVDGDYHRHAEAARAVAETHFDSDKVLSHLIERALNGSHRPTAETRRAAKSHRGPGQATAAHAAAPELPRLVGKRRSMPLATLRDNLAEHSAVTTWASLGLGRAEPERLEVLKQGKKGAVYRLVGVGPRGAAVIAKRCRRERGVTERTAYEEVLTQLALPTIEYYGCVAEQDEQFWWLFLEDAGDELYSPLVQGHRSMAAEWLGQLHVATERLRGTVTLPDRGPGHYRAYLRSARRGIPDVLERSSLKPTAQSTLLNIFSMCEFLEESWDHIERAVACVPRTFVHGDCLAKNVHVRAVESGVAIAPFDWGGAGWGLPATDLGQLALPYRGLPQTEPDCGAYLASVLDAWPSLDLGTVEQLANLGQMFWALKVISRGLPEFAVGDTHVDSLAEHFAVYRTVLGGTIRGADWGD